MAARRFYLFLVKLFCILSIVHAISKNKTIKIRLLSQRNLLRSDPTKTSDQSVICNNLQRYPGAAEWCIQANKTADYDKGLWDLYHRKVIIPSLMRKKRKRSLDDDIDPCQEAANRVVQNYVGYHGRINIPTVLTECNPLPTLSFCATEFLCKCVPTTTTIQIRSRRSINVIKVQAGCKIKVSPRETVSSKVPRSLRSQLGTPNHPKTHFYVLSGILLIGAFIILLAALVFKFSKNRV